MAAAIVDELIRCGLREVVVAPGSRSAPLAMEFFRREQLGEVRLQVRIDERSAAFTALGLAKTSRVPAAVVCTSGTAAAHFHAAVIEADESCVPLLVLTADRPPELRGTGANQTIDQLKLYGGAVRWFCELGVAEAGVTGLEAYWRSAMAKAWALASAAAGGPAGPVHVNLPFREPLVPEAGLAGAGEAGGRADGAPWTEFGPVARVGWTERGLIVCGDGDYDAAPLFDLAAAAGWPLLAEPSSNARSGPMALSAYQYLIGAARFLAAHRPDVIVSAGRPGLSRGQLALLRGGAARHVVLAQGPGRWSDPARTATDVAGRVELAGGAGVVSEWLRDWRRADAAVRAAVDAKLDEAGLSEPMLAREVAAALPDGGLLWAASSQPVRDLDAHLHPRTGLRIVASRGASGIDGLVSSAIGAALAHQAAGGGRAVALLGDLALLHDSPGLALGPAEPRPDLCLIVVNNNGGGIFSMLEQAAFPEPFERVFGTPHDADFSKLAAAVGLPYQRIQHPGDVAEVVRGSGFMLAELRSERPGQAALRAALTGAAAVVLR
ncbi:MAG TPA: 2-succinyl-5-enolpyruvyl-6-hydroxy-3-cyclohexene-1-carboxylic-acid synthase [Streptosporangiaceae bacterium]|nr:2-succinyl-5-enolpyruvyl-6-hydroxy-3-cyclohexene-1-carboxylic-acid synthase [Streptosporangiaceae bacterium]